MEAPDQQPGAPPSALTRTETSAKPVPVEVHQPAPDASETLFAVLQPLVNPLTTSVIVLIFVTFFLFQREDLRNRFIASRVIGALRLAQANAELGRLDDVRPENIFKTVSDLVEDLAEHGKEGADAKAKETDLSAPERKVVSLAGGDFGKPVFCVPGLGRLDDSAALVVADALKREGINARVAGAITASEDGEASSICLCYVENVPKARIDYAVRKLSKKSPEARIVVCLFSENEPSGVSSAPQHERDRSGSLLATIGTLKNPRGNPKASSGTNGTSKSLGFN